VSALLDFIKDYFSNRNTYLRRMAEALERIAPLPEEPIALTPDEEVSYVDEEKMAQRDLAEEAHLIEQWLAEHPEAQEEVEEEEGKEDVRS
jgi:hypothetical protein